MGSGKRFQHRLAQSLLVTVMLWAACPLMAATNVKLSGTMPTFGSVQDFQISPDGRYAIYRASQNTVGVFELYSVQLPGGIPIRLNPLLPSDRSVFLYGISPDSSRVIYQATQDTAQVVELYSVPIAGPPEASVKLNGSLVPNGNVQDFQISPDSNRVIYKADREEDEHFELYSVPINGPAIAGIKINNIIVTNGGVRSFQISPDSKRVIYKADQETAGIDELYSVPTGGPSAAGVKLTGLLIGGEVSDFQISSDSNWVVYKAAEQTDGIYSVSIGGPASTGVKITGPMIPNSIISMYNISPDSLKVVYLADQITDGIYEIISVPIRGPSTACIKLNESLEPNGSVYPFFSYISPDSQRAIFLASKTNSWDFELFSVPINGPAEDGVKLNRAMVLNGDVIYGQISPDSSRVVYLADQDTDNIGELYSVPIAGPATSGVKLNVPIAPGDFIHSFQFSPDGRQVVYRLDQIPDQYFSLYNVPIGGPSTDNVVINVPVLSLKMFRSYTYQITPDSGRVLYVDDQDIDGTFELFMTSFDETPDPFTLIDLTGVPLNSPITSNMITVVGITTGTPVSITGGEYALNGGAYTSGAGMVNSGDTVLVRLTSSNSFSTTTEAILIIGGVSETFSVTTMGLSHLFLPLILR